MPARSCGGGISVPVMITSPGWSALAGVGEPAHDDVDDLVEIAPRASGSATCSPSHEHARRRPAGPPLRGPSTTPRWKMSCGEHVLELVERAVEVDDLERRHQRGDRAAVGADLDADLGLDMHRVDRPREG